MLKQKEGLIPCRYCRCHRHRRRPFDFLPSHSHSLSVSNKLLPESMTWLENLALGNDSVPQSSREAIRAGYEISNPDL